MKVPEILTEKKKAKKKKRKTKVNNMYSFRTPVGGFGAWYWGVGGVPVDTGTSDGGGDGGGD